MKTWFPFLGSVVVVLAGFAWQYLGNSEFRGNVKRGVFWLRAKVFKEFFFWSIYFPSLLIVLFILYQFSALRITTSLGAYSIWITIWCLHIKKRTRNVSTIISCKLGDTNSENGNDGLIYIRHRDGDAIKELFGSDYIRRTNFADKVFYIYFRIRPDIVDNFKEKHCIVLVEFFDRTNKGAFDVEYDSCDKKIPQSNYKECEAYNYTGSNKWKLAQFNIPDPAFIGRQNNKSDFRLRISPRVKSTYKGPDLFVRKVICISLNN